MPVFYYTLDELKFIIAAYGITLLALWIPQNIMLGLVFRLWYSVSGGCDSPAPINVSSGSVWGDGRHWRGSSAARERYTPG